MRILVLSVGNTSLFGGVFTGARRMASFRLPASDLVKIRRYVAGRIDGAVVCSVVPELTADVMRCIRRCWNVDAQLLTFDSPHGLALGYRHPRELGTDRIASAMGARIAYPRKNIVVVDCGTATTVTALRRDGTLLGGAILPGLSLWPKMLASATAQLPPIKLRRPRVALARSTGEAIASGVFFGHVGAIREMVARVRAEAFGRARCEVVGTGGHAHRFGRENLFTAIEPTLVLQGLRAFAVRTFSL
jgi:type III pantothenate kinase